MPRYQMSTRLALFTGYGQAPASAQQGGDNGGQGGGGFQRPHAWGGGQRLGN